MPVNYGSLQNADQTRYSNDSSGLTSTTVRDAIDELWGMSSGGTAVDQPCDASVSVGSVVRASVSGIVKALADTADNSRWVGVCVAKPTSTTCNIRLSGAVDAFTGLDVTKTYSLSKTIAGGIEETNATVGISMFIGTPLNSTTLILEKKRGHLRT